MSFEDSRDGSNAVTKSLARSGGNTMRLRASSYRRTTVTPTAVFDETSQIMRRFQKRHNEDAKNRNSDLDLTEILKFKKYVPNDGPDAIRREPSYSKFKIPYSMICSKRYRETKKAYEAQLHREISNNIDFQSTAAEACYFMRCVAYTTFWPPLHHMREVTHTSKHFFQLTEKEKWRFNYLMNTDIV